ncbi:MAG: transglutaminase-like domain-containing protein, partial [Spirochaetaceae bacterium]|nr:transglutaminase-like domain-containing protein [Spirochaetaceae bacterium]
MGQKELPVQNQSGHRGLIPRIAACYVMLIHVCLFYGEAAEPVLFATMLLQAVFLPVILCVKKVRTLPAALILLLVPYAVRLFFMLLRLVPMAAPAESGGPAGFVPYDAALLAYDSTLQAALFPCYWLSLSILCAVRLPRLRRIFPACDLVLLCALFVIFSAEETDVYKWPILKLCVFCAIVFLEMLSLVLSAPPGLFPERREKTAACAVPLAAVIIAGLLLFRPLNEQALGSGGGLLRPDVFSFDFAPFLRLENEISMNDDLIFIVRKESKGGGDEYMQNNDVSPNNTQETNTQKPDIQETDIQVTDIQESDTQEAGEPDGPGGDDFDGMDDDFSLDDEDFLGFPPDFDMDDLAMLLSKNKNILTRRFVLSAYNSENGFTRDETIDERIQSRRVPSGKIMAGAANGGKRRYRLEQEYYLVNIDGGAFLAMNEPVAVTPFEQYPASSFKAAYRVESFASSAPEYELSRTAPALPGDGLSAEEFAWFTAFSNPKTGPTATETRITELAAGLAASQRTYWDVIQVIYEYLKYGDYLYSLKPGIAADGDQLAYFLFESKKGYCSYFAFAFASMLRSIGIPCRVAVGFFLDPSTERFGFYPVLANMAHAWVEVWFPDYGWIEYDPTTDNLAPGEQWRFSSGPPG